MVEPFYDKTGEGTIHTVMWAQRFKDLRDFALELPKFGTKTANDEVCLTLSMFKGHIHELVSANKRIYYVKESLPCYFKLLTA